MHFGLPEILVVLFVLLLVFGPGKIPQLGDAIGRGIRNFKKSARGDEAIDVTPKGQGQLDEKAAPQATSQQSSTADANRGGRS